MWWLYLLCLEYLGEATSTKKTEQHISAKPWMTVSATPLDIMLHNTWVASIIIHL